MPVGGARRNGQPRRFETKPNLRQKGELGRLRDGTDLENESVEARTLKTGLFQGRMFPERFSSEQTVPGQVRSLPENVKAFNDNLDTNSVNSRVIESRAHFGGEPDKSENNLAANQYRAVGEGQIKANGGVRWYHMKDDDIPSVKIAGITGAKVFGTVGKDNLPNIESLNGRIGRGKIDYPSNNDGGQSRPFISEMIADDQVGPRIMDLSWLQRYCDARYQSKSGRPTNPEAFESDTA